MREIDKKYSIKKKKQMKTTTFLAVLLICATLILSSAVTLSTTTMNENTTTVLEKDEVGGDIVSSGIPPDDSIATPHIREPVESLEYQEEMRAKGTNTRAVLYDNGMEFTNLGASQDAYDYPFTAGNADDFVLPGDGVVNAVRWIGGYWNPADDHMFDWVITFMNDDGTGNAPNADPFGGGTPYAGPFHIAYADITMFSVGTAVFEMNAVIPETSFTGGQKYWICIHGYGEFGTGGQSGFGFQGDDIKGAPGVMGFPLLGAPFWTVASPDRNNAFQLSYAFDHDVAPVKIKAPQSGGMECGSLPVEVTVENLGKNDETGVDVNIEIRHYQFIDGFETFIGDVWDANCGGNCLWQFVPAETRNPMVVLPYKGAQMAELDQWNCVSGVSNMWTIYPMDFTCKCNPRASFMMWHDEYGSDDYIEFQISTTGPGGPWTTVGGPYKRVDPSCGTGWMEHIVDLEAYNHSTANVHFQFVGHCAFPQYNFNLHIDEFKVYDLEYAVCTKVDLLAGEQKQVEFPPWTPCKWQKIKNEYWDFNVIVCTKLGDCTEPKDEWPFNDCLEKVVTLYFPCFHDVGGYSIISPPTCGDPLDAQTFDMKGTIKNFGQYEECCFDAYMRVYEASGATLLFYEDFEDDTWNWPPISGCGPWNDDQATANWNVGWADCVGWNALEFYWIPYGAPTDSLMYTCMIDTSGYGCVDISFVHYLSHFDGDYTLSVECSSDGVNWYVIDEWVNPTGFGCTWEYYQSCLCTGGPFYLGFRFVGPDPYNLNWWTIDEISIYGVNKGAMIWEDHFCVDVLPVCSELEIDFGEDWTPEPPNPCYCGVKKFIVCIEADMCTYDQTPSNDEFCRCIEIRFWHDVGIMQFTEPCITPVAGGGPILYGQLPWFPYPAGITSHEGYGYKVYDNFVLNFDPHDPPGYEQICDIHWWGAGGIFEECSGWTPCACCDFEFDIGFYEDDGGVPGDLVCLYEDIDYTCEVFVDGFGTGWDACYYEADFDPCCPFEDNIGWVSIQSQGFGDCAFLWIDSFQGDGQAYQEGHPTNPVIPYDMAFNLTGSDEEIPPVIECMIPCGEDDLCVIVKNYGTYIEDCTVHYQLFKWDGVTLVEVATGSVEDVILDPGEEEEVCFDPYEFEMDGIYFLWVWIDPDLGEYHDDCMPCNNYDGLGIGVDCCAPESCHELSPVEPDGNNNWYISPVTVHLYAWDPCVIASGIKEIVYILDGVENSIPGDDGSFIISGDGVHHVEFYAVDNVGHEEEIHHSFEVAIDTTDPSIDLVYETYQDENENWMVDFTALAGDATSGMDKVEFYIGSQLLTTVTGAGPYQYTYTWQSGDGGKTFSAKAFDNAGNDASDSAVIKLTKDASTTVSTSLPVSTNKVLILGR